MTRARNSFVIAAMRLVGVLVAAITFHASAHPLHPDLVIEDVQVAAAQPTQLRVKVANQGLVIAPQSQLRVYFHRGAAVQDRITTVPRLETGERQWLVIEAGPTLVGADKVTLVVDELSWVDESDEGNNVYVLE